MSRSLENYIRMHRRSHALSQEELASLVSGLGATAVLRHETYERVPTLETAIAYAVIFRVDPRELFAGLFEEAEAGIAERAEVMLEQLPPSRASAEVDRKRRLLEEIVSFSEPHLVPCEE